MAYLTTDAIKAWLEPTKLDVASVEGELEAHITNQVLGAAAHTYDISTWTDSASTPPLVLTVMSMMYASAYYRRAYSEEPGSAGYAFQLSRDANSLLTSIIDGTLPLLDVESLTTDQPSFYPTDVSSAMTPTAEDPSLGPAAFSMGRIW